jgi:thiazole synthase ThiGH ThiG subunit
MKIAAASLLAFSALTTACVNSSTLQTAKALDPGRQRVLVGGGFYSSPDINADASEASKSDVTLAMPYMELGYRRGIVDKVELGAKVTVPGTAGIDGKYQFLDAGKLALAAGIGVGYLKLTSGSEGMETSSTIVDTTVPVYASYDIAKAFAVYTAPKYVLRYTKSVDDMGATSSGMNHLVGATVGTRLGNRWGLFLETSYLKSVSSDFDAFQVNGSIFF